MINRKELMIDSIVQVDGILCTISVMRHLTCELHGFPSIVDYERLEPVILSKEILLKIGFKDEGRDFLLKLDGGPILYFYADNPICFIRMELNYTEEVSLFHIKHVHQLQNLIYSLTGEHIACSLV